MLPGNTDADSALDIEVKYGAMRFSITERDEEGGTFSWIHPLLICVMASGFSL